MIPALLGVRLDDVVAFLAGDVRVAAKRADSERHPHRQPGQRVRTGDALDLVEMDDGGGFAI